MDNFFQLESSQEFRYFSEDQGRWGILSNLKNKEKHIPKLLEFLKTKGIKKAIPGGKYGCCLMLKTLFSEEIKNISMGKLISFVKKSVTDQLYVHLKTLIVKNNFYVLEEEIISEKLAQL